MLVGGREVLYSNGNSLTDPYCRRLPCQVPVLSHSSMAGEFCIPLEIADDISLRLTGSPLHARPSSKA